MADTHKSFQDFLKEETDRVKGVYYPVGSGILRRLLVRSAPPSKLHPNPEDDFCLPGIGPNYGIIAHYEREYRQGNTDPLSHDSAGNDGILQPIVVQKARPNGYLILNGHHRWAAGIRSGVGRLSVRVVSLTQEKDIRRMLRHSRSDRRAALDLDEVVFCAEDGSAAEKPMPFPLSRIRKESVRLGVPALMHYLNSNDYDIWVYTSKYYSMEYIRAFLRRWNVRLTGIVTGTARRDARFGDALRDLKEEMNTRYQSTVHIDSRLILRTFGGSRECEEYPLGGGPAVWAREVMETLDRIDQRKSKTKPSVGTPE